MAALARCAGDAKTRLAESKARHVRATIEVGLGKARKEGGSMCGVGGGGADTFFLLSCDCSAYSDTASLDAYYCF